MQVHSIKLKGKTKMEILKYGIRTCKNVAKVRVKTRAKSILNCCGKQKSTGTTERLNRLRRKIGCLWAKVFLLRSLPFTGVVDIV